MVKTGKKKLGQGSPPPPFLGNARKKTFFYRSPSHIYRRHTFFWNNYGYVTSIRLALRSRNLTPRYKQKRCVSQSYLKKNSRQTKDDLAKKNLGWGWGVPRPPSPRGVLPRSEIHRANKIIHRPTNDICRAQKVSLRSQNPRQVDSEPARSDRAGSDPPC